MNSEILSEIIERHETADSFISLFFTLIDIIIYIVILFIFGCEFNKKIFLYSQKHSLLLIYNILKDCIIKNLKKIFDYSFYNYFILMIGVKSL